MGLLTVVSAAGAASLDTAVTDMAKAALFARMLRLELDLVRVCAGANIEVWNIQRTKVW